MEDEIKKDEPTNLSTFTKMRGKVADLYGGEDALNNRIGRKVTLGDLQKIRSQDAQKLYGKAIEAPETSAGISEAAYYMSNAYSNIIDYYKNLFYIRYTMTPVYIGDPNSPRAKTGQDTEEYGKIYYRMVGGVEGLNLENLVPYIIEQTLIRGRCAVITERNVTSETIYSYFLPIEYTKTIGRTQFGTNIIAFNYKYFDDLRNTANGVRSAAVADTDFESILKTMPKILQEGYRIYRENGPGVKWYPLDSKTATEFMFNSLGIPPKLGAFPASVDFNSYKRIKLQDTAQALDSILTHQIPTNQEGDLIMDVDEAKAVTNSMKNALTTVPNVKVLTTFGPTDLFNVKANEESNARMLETAYNNIYSSAGVDYHVFVSDKDLEVSIKRDKAYIWGFMQNIMNFYNYTFNNLISFKPYQVQINLIPVTAQLEEKELELYLKEAGTGIGRLQAIVASGIKQRDIKANSELEDFLQLDKILKPLQSMYTSSYKASQKDNSEKESSSNEDTVKENEKEPDLEEKQ